MALLFLDSFDHSGTTGAMVLKKWDVDNGIAIISTTTVRTGTGALFLQSSGALLKVIPLPGDVFILGCAIRCPAWPTSTNLVEFLEGATLHVALAVNASGFLVVKRDTTVLATATSGPLAINTWYYLEVKVVVHDSAGSVAVRIDAVPLTFSASLTGVDTRNGGTGNVDRLGLRGGGGTGVFVDDLYLCDDAGTTNNDFLGICVVERLLPSTGNGDLTDFTPSTGTDHGALVDENPPTDDTDYNTGDTVGQQDCYQYPSLALTGAILGIQTNLYARKTDAGARTVAPIVRLGSVTYPGAAVAPTTSYKYLTEVRETNPATGLAWTSADITALQAGMKIVS